MTDPASLVGARPALDGAPWLGARTGVGVTVGQHDWSATPLGPLGDWPPALRVMMLFMLDSPQPTCLAWGPELLLLYNDGYAKLLGERHPGCLGLAASIAWRDRWDRYRPYVEQALSGQAVSSDGLPAIDAAHADDQLGCAWTPVRDAQGAVGGLLCVAEAGNVQQNQRQLAAEVQHRVRNTLAVIRSIARRTADNSDTVDQYRMHFDGRLAAYARTQGYLTRNPGLGVDLGAMVADELLTHQLGDGQRAAFEGPSVRLPPRVADQVGLAIHELTANAVKFGALGARGGRLAVSWWVEGAPGAAILHLDWRETVASHAITRPTHEGFGTELLQRALPYELAAEVALDFRADGLHCTMAIPLTPP
jgi:two-component sensor histidine kinase